MPLPEKPSLEWLRKQAKARLQTMRREDPAAQLASAQLAVAREHGFPSWRALKTHVDGLSVDGRLFEAARAGNLSELTTLLDRHPEQLHVRDQPYEWTLLHAAANRGQLPVVDELLRRGLHPDTREKGDNTTAMHWAAAGGHVEVVRRLVEAGADVIGSGDDHALEIIGWATCWHGCDDGAHREVAELLVSRGARHHIFSAVALSLADEVRRIVARDPASLNARQSRNENHRTALHFAVEMKRADMVELLLELGADPLAVDGSGQTAAAYTDGSGTDRAVMEKVRGMLDAELVSAERGSRAPRIAAIDLTALLALGDWDRADLALRHAPQLIESGTGVLHLLAQRNDVDGAAWLLTRGADVNGRWSSHGAVVTPLHLAASRGHAAMVRLLLEAGADASVRDSVHDSDARGWAEFFKRPDIVRILDEAAAKR